MWLHIWLDTEVAVFIRLVHLVLLTKGGNLESQRHNELNADVSLESCVNNTIRCSKADFSQFSYSMNPFSIYVCLACRK